MKRQRTRGRNPGQKPQNNNPNRAYESNGPDIKVRGSAQTVFEKYQQLSRDANSAGDRVLGENYQQHAEHYFRVLRAMQPTFVPRSEMMIAGYDDDLDDGDESGETAEGTENEANEADDSPSTRDFNPNRQQRDNRLEGRGETRQDGEEDRFSRRRRRRRDRFGNDIPYNSNAGNGIGDDVQHDVQRIPRIEQRSDNRADNRSGNRYDSRTDVREVGQDSVREGRFEKQGDKRGYDDTLTPIHSQEVYSLPVRSTPNEFDGQASYSEPDEIIKTPQDASARTRRPRPPRAPREARKANEEDQGFGSELPAFLSTPVPTPGGE
ncbi:hypothetical protein PsB1_1545 [Candidatus Phycosocius spiralis]|uniref:DUF4167 domain-containing protein n=2 Tax=Candidatus Phycosocius spiralis TaxID=2815099 RepID=A0ABQ4PWI1_9PROT|nr:hypothetical protein PsB1_1545 [Candidatus Phycosocius spiralis]